MPLRRLFLESIHSQPHVTKTESQSRSLTQTLRSKMTWSTSLLHLSVVAALLLSSLQLKSYAVGAQCTSHTQPNPIATTYPNNATGVLNVTLAILPIPMSTARELIPSEWGILESAYRSILPDFPQGMYPVMIQAGLDHDIQFASLGASIADFSVCTAQGL